MIILHIYYAVSVGVSDVAAFDVGDISADSGEIGENVSRRYSVSDRTRVIDGLAALVGVIVVAVPNVSFRVPPKSVICL